jgi:hypothetical protein
MRIIHTDQDLPTDALGQLAVYSGMDVLSLFEIANELHSLFHPQHQRIYSFEMELHSALFEMAKNGLHVDVPMREVLIKDYTAQESKISSYLHQLCIAVGYYDYYIQIARLRFASEASVDVNILPFSWEGWTTLPLNTRKSLKQRAPKALATFHKALKEFGTPFNGNSPAQKLRLFFDFFGHEGNTVRQELTPDFYPAWNKTRGISEIKTRSISGDYTPGVDRDVLDRLQKKALESTLDAAIYWAQPFISCCMALADISKILGFLRCKLENGIFRYSFGAVTETGRLNSKANAQGYGSNAQNVAKKNRVIFTTPLGWKFIAIDYSQIESRNVAAICFTLFGAVRYLAAVDSGDAHSLTCALVWPDRAWPEEFTIDHCIKYGPFPKDILKAARKVASEEFYRGKSLRDASKILGHGSNYLGQPPTMSKHSHIPVKLIEQYQTAYFGEFLELKLWHQHVATQIQTTQTITTLFGRERRFLGRPTDDATLREAVAYEPQSMAADYCNSALIKLHKAQLEQGLPFRLVVQKHDELIARFPEDREEEVVRFFTETMEQHIVLTSPTGETRDWYVPAEAETGWNLSQRSESNPDGLSYPGLARTRIRNPFNLLDAQA